jgi:hypothetical protein
MAEAGPTTDATSVIAQSPQEPEVSAASSLPFAALAGGSAAGPAGVRQLARRSAGDRAAVIGALSHGAGNAAVARMLGAAAGPRVLQRDEFPPAAPATSAPAAAPASAAPAAGSPGADPATDPAADQAKSETWQHPEVRQRAVPIEAAPAKAAPKDRGLDLYVQLVPSVVRAVKGYSTAGGDQIPLENAMLIIAQGTAEHAPYDPGLANKPVIPAGNMRWGITRPQHIHGHDEDDDDRGQGRRARHRARPRVSRV